MLTYTSIAYHDYLNEAMHKNHANKEESMIVYKKNKHTALFIPGKIKVLSHGF